MTREKTNIHPLVEQYVSDVCSQVKAKEIRPDIQEELLGHLDELIDARLAAKPDEDREAATRWAIRQMGASHEVASGLNRVHKPRIPWAMLGALGLLLIIAIIVMYAVTDAYASSEMGMFPRRNFAINYILYTALGLAAMFLLSRIHYQRIIQHANWLYALTVILMLVTLTWGSTLNGASILMLGTVSVNFYETSVYILMVLAAISLSRGNPASWQDVVWHLSMYTVVPLVLYGFAYRYSYLMIYALASTILILIYRRTWRWLVPQAGLLMAIGGYLLFFNHYGSTRIASLFEMVASGDYLIQQTGEAIRSSSWFGHGVGSIADRLRYIHSESIFTFIVHSLGWLFGISVLACILLLMHQFVRAARQVRHTPGRMIIHAIVIVLAIQYLINIPMALGWLPVLSIPMPFISYGGSALLTNLAAIGLIYSIYRLKDMVRVTA